MRVKQACHIDVCTSKWEWHFTSLVIFPKIYNPSLVIGEASGNSQFKDIVQNTGTENCQDHEKQGKSENLSLEKTKETC